MAMLILTSENSPRLCKSSSSGTMRSKMSATVSPILSRLYCPLRYGMLRLHDKCNAPDIRIYAAFPLVCELFDWSRLPAIVLPNSRRAVHHWMLQLAPNGRRRRFCITLRGIGGMAVKDFIEAAVKAVREDRRLQIALAGAAAVVVGKLLFGARDGSRHMTPQQLPFAEPKSVTADGCTFTVQRVLPAEVDSAADTLAAGLANDAMMAACGYEVSLCV